MLAVYDRYLDPARKRPAFWRLGLGLALTVFVYALWTAGVIWLGWRLSGSALPVTHWAVTVLDPEATAGTVALLATFPGLALGPFLAARWLHKRPAATLFGPAARTMRDFAIGLAITGGLLGLSVLLWSVAFDVVPNLDPLRWLRLLPIALLLLAVQTGAEEILFRGYLQSQLAARFRSRLVYLGLPALLFGIVHFDPASAGASAWLVVGSATLFGLIAGDLTARTGSIGAAWGLHFANNALAIALISTTGTITGLSLFRTPYEITDTATVLPLIPGNLAILLIAWWLIGRYLSR